jgi:uncharacterized protein (TIGR00255 family)
MIKSMTGYGKAEATVGSKKFTVEIRALNSKLLDLGIRMPSIYKQKEMMLRNFFSREIIRGKVDVTIFYEADGTEKKVTINKPLMASYAQDFRDVAESIGQKDLDIMSLLIRIPDVLQPQREELDENEWGAVMKLVEQATANLNEYREKEGAEMDADFRARVAGIRKYQAALEIPLSQRIEKVRERIKGNLEEFVESAKIDPNRFEQEVVYYLEKLDISEERVRLGSNLDYFMHELDEGTDQGKKLGFIAQEIGREINTMGSKANDADVQRFVVKMKDDLEKIKEQVLNVL